MSDNKDDNKDVGGDMRANTLLLSGLLATLIASTGAIANDNIVALQLGTPSENEKLSIFTADAKYHHMF